MMDKAKVLNTFKKANKVRRNAMAIKAGFASSEAFLAFLNGSEAIAPAKPNRRNKKAKIENVTGSVPTIHNVFILDDSGSMSGGKFNNAVIGINTEIGKLQEDNTVNYTQSIVTLNRGTNDFLTPIKNVKKFAGKASGGTPLYQTIGETLERLSKAVSPNDKVLVKIFTDGEENQSQGAYDPYTGGAGKLRTLINALETRGFTITFVGTKYDVDSMINQLKIDSGNTLVHDNTARGVADSFLSTTSATMFFAADVKEGKDVTRGFYKKVGKL